ncbi:sporulation-induced protein, partial [Coemansia sp. RSA 2322]
MVEYIATEEFFKFSKLASTSCEVLCSNSMAFAETLVASYSARDFVESDDEEEEEEEEDNYTDDDDAVSSTAPLSKAPSSFSARSATATTNTTSGGPRPLLLELLWGIMRLPSGQLDSQQATYFSRVMCNVLQRKPYEALDFVRGQGGDAVTQFLAHLGVSAIVDLLLKVISLEELENTPGIIAWLSEFRLVPMLVARLAPTCDPETHSLAAQVLLDIIAISQCNNPAQPTIGSNALIEELKSEATITRLADFMLDCEAPHATSTLINCVYIFIELIRRNYSDSATESPAISSATDDEDTAGAFQPANSTVDDGSSPSPPRLPSVDLSDMMRVLALRTGDLVALLKTPRGATEPVPTTQGLREPLGFERLRICELFAELLHCSNMPRLNHHHLLLHHKERSTTPAPAEEEEEEETGDAASPPLSHTPYADVVAAVVSKPSDHAASNTAVGQLLKWQLIQNDVLPTCTDLFFRFPLNNFLHSVVYDIMHQVLNLPLGIECNVALIVAAFRDVRITSRIAQACAANDIACRTTPHQGRLGYMGHLTGIGEEVARLLELSGAALEPLIAPYIDGDEWLDYVARTLQEVRDRDQQPLGGERPPGSTPSDSIAAADSAQVFVSRMGLVDPSQSSVSESYGPEDDDEDDDDAEYSRHHNAPLSSASKRSMMYPNEEDDDDDEAGIEYINARHRSRLYFNSSMTGEDDNGDQFIIKDDDDYDDDDDYVNGSAATRDIGPAGRIGRYRSYQNERSSAGNENGAVA